VRGNQPARRLDLVVVVTTAPATILLATLLAFMFSLQAEAGAVGDVERLLEFGALSTDVTVAEFWRLVSYGWLHADVHHLLSNVTVLVPLGLLLESAVGSRRVLVVYAASVVAGGVASLIVEQPTCLVGASSGVWGLLGAAVVLAVRPADRLRAAETLALRQFLLPLLVLGAFTSLIPGISLAGHAGGFVVGLLGAGTGALWAGTDARHVGEPDPGWDLRTTAIFMVPACCCGQGWLLVAGLLVVSVGVWLTVARYGPEPTLDGSVSTWAGVVATCILAAGLLSAMASGRVWEALTPKEPPALVLHLDLPPLAVEEQELSFEIVDRTNDPYLDVAAVLRGMSRPAVVNEDACPTVWTHTQVHRLFPTVVLRATPTTEHAHAELRAIPCEPEILPVGARAELHLGAGALAKARELFQEAVDNDPEDLRARLQLGRWGECAQVIRDVKAAELSDDRELLLLAAEVLERCDPDRASRLSDLAQEEEE
jgi:membrane associated rhomboid family serine protease